MNPSYAARRMLALATVALGSAFVLAGLAAAARTSISTSVSGTCTVSATLTWSNVRDGSLVDIEFLPTSGSDAYSSSSAPATSVSGSFTHSYQFASSDNGSWVAHFTFLYANGKPAYEKYTSFRVSCRS